MRPEIPLLVSEAEAVTVTVPPGFCKFGTIDTIETVGAVRSSITVPSVTLTALFEVSVAVFTIV